MLSRPRGVRLHVAQATAARVGVGEENAAEKDAAAACVHRCTCVADADVGGEWRSEVWGWEAKEREREGTWWREKQGAREVRSEGRRIVMTDE